MNNLIIITFLFLYWLLLFFLMLDHASLWLILLTFTLILASWLTLLIFLVRHLMYWTRDSINNSGTQSAGMIALSSLVLGCFSLAPFLRCYHISLVGHLDGTHLRHVHGIQKIGVVTALLEIGTSCWISTLLNLFWSLTQIIFISCLAIHDIDPARITLALITFGGRLWWISDSIFFFLLAFFSFIIKNISFDRKAIQKL